MPLIVEPADPASPGATALLQASHALMDSLFPPEENHFLSIEALRAPHIHFFVARTGADPVGTIALASYPDYGELKSLFVDQGARGSGAADALLRQAEDHARTLDLPVLRLETGNKLDAAIRFYTRHGYVTCPPFGDYTANATSVFMEKAL